MNQIDLTIEKEPEVPRDPSSRVISKTKALKDKSNLDFQSSPSLTSKVKSPRVDSNDHGQLRVKKIDKAS